MRRKLAIGAHPGYADRANFGRLELDLSADEIAESVFEQVSKLGEIAAKCGARVGHVKAHGALYNQAARDAAVAEAVADGVARWRRDVVLVGLAGSADARGLSTRRLFRCSGGVCGPEVRTERLAKIAQIRGCSSFLILRKRPHRHYILLKPPALLRQTAGKFEWRHRRFAFTEILREPLKIAAAIGERLKNAGIELRPLAAGS